MINLSYMIIMVCISAAIVLAWAYFGRYTISRPPIGVFDFTDLIVMCFFIILTPYLYLIFPLWLAGGLLALGTLNILYLLWEAILRKTKPIWAVVLGMLLLDIAAAFIMTTRSNTFFLVNNIVIVVAVIGLANLWAQSGMKARHIALMAFFLTAYDFVATSKLTLMSEMLNRLATLPFAPILAWTTDGLTLSVGLGDLLMVTLFPLIMRKAFGPVSGIVAMVVGMVAIGILLISPSSTVFPAMVVLGPLMVLQYVYWRVKHRRERTMRQYLAVP